MWEEEEQQQQIVLRFVSLCRPHLRKSSVTVTATVTVVGMSRVLIDLWQMGKQARRFVCLLLCLRNLLLSVEGRTTFTLFLGNLMGKTEQEEGGGGVGGVAHYFCINIGHALLIIKQWNVGSRVAFVAPRLGSLH